MYTALVLTDIDRNYLLRELFSDINIQIPSGWELLTHHCTLNMGKNKRFQDLDDGSFAMIITHFAINDQVAAVKVKILDTRIESDNAVPHITIAVNRRNGGKPFLSNRLKGWQAFDAPITVVGELLECY